jgi:hypothetical protein
MQAPGTLLLTRSDVAMVLTLPDCIAAVDEGFRLEGRGEIQPPSILGVHAPYGGLHVKAGYLGLDRPVSLPRSTPTSRRIPGATVCPRCKAS